MSLYRGFFNKKGPTTPAPVVEPTRRIVRTETVEKARPAVPAAPAPAMPTMPAMPAVLATPVSGRMATNPVTETPGLQSGPIVGWLAIIAGPGRGEVLRLGYGVNDIGSGPNARVQMNFGDASIASDNHAAIIYTTRSRRFYLAQSAVSETWLNGQPVRESVELAGGETLQFGRTQVRFVPLCGPSFDWRDSE